MIKLFSSNSQELAGKNVYLAVIETTHYYGELLEEQAAKFIIYIGNHV